MVVREAALFFEPVHVTVWELMAMASAKVAQQGDALLMSPPPPLCEPHIEPPCLPTLQLSHSMLYGASFPDTVADPWSSSSTGAVPLIFAGIKLVAENINWDDAREVWVAEGAPLMTLCWAFPFRNTLDGVSLCIGNAVSHLPRCTGARYCMLGELNSHAAEVPQSRHDVGYHCYAMSENIVVPHRTVS